jgi:hypothetical protein
MRMGDWLRLAAENRFRIDPIGWGMAGAVTGFATINSTFALAQRLLYCRKIEAATIGAPPIFILGHWRTGTITFHSLAAMNSCKGLRHLTAVGIFNANEEET